MMVLDRGPFEAAGPEPTLVDSIRQRVVVRNKQCRDTHVRSAGRALCGRYVRWGPPRTPSGVPYPGRVALARIESTTDCRHTES